MGNRTSCCLTDSSSEAPGRRYQAGGHTDHYVAPNQRVGMTNDNNALSSNWSRDESTNLQHISEREPDDYAEDPSSHPTKGPMFEAKIKERSLLNAKIDTGRSMLVVEPNSYYCISNAAAHNGNVPRDSARPSHLQKASSCSTIFLDDSTISQPNLKTTLKCVSLAIHVHIKTRKNREGHERLMDIFDEKRHPITRDPIPRHYDVIEPEQRHIYRFIRTLFTSAQLTAECAIITLVYIERLLTYAEIDLCPAYWRRIVLGAVLLASKVWDDQAVWNVDYCQILKDCTVEDMNELERQFLECLEFNINVPSSVYAKYYFTLRTLAMQNDLQLPLQPLYKERAKQLEALSRTCEDRLIERKAKRRWSSLDRFLPSPKNTVIIP